MTTRGAGRFALTGAAAVLVCLAAAAEAQPGWTGRGGVVVATGGSFRGAPPVATRGAVWVGGTHGTAWRGGAWGGNVWVGGGRPPAWGWRPGWGGWGWRPGWGGWGGWWGPGWAGWGPGWSTPAWGWGPGWGWSVTAPIVVAPPVVTGAWVLPPSATVYIERSAEVADGTAPAAPAAPVAPAAQQWWYWCNSARAYYPYVNSCPEPWQRVEPQVPPGMQ